jgi:sulfoxide reductase heme-binding subunit YedZ
MHTDPTPHLFWITSRAAGVAALVLASLAVSLGLLMSTKLLRGRVADLRVTHEILSLSTIAAIVVHAATLLGDKFLHPSVVDIAVPFASSYKTAWMSLGIIGGWSLTLLGISYYARRTIGAKRWRKLHRFTALAWVAGLVHAIGMGTDAGQTWFLAMIGIVVVPALALLITRLAGRGARPTPRVATPGRTVESGRPAQRPHLPARGVVPPRRTPARTLL